MTEIYLPKIIRDKFMEQKKMYCDKLIKEYQRNYEKKEFGDKSPEEKIKCPICGGKYGRFAKTRHTRTKKHQEKINEIYNYV